jgi:hypothetical protein
MRSTITIVGATGEKIRIQDSIKIPFTDWRDKLFPCSPLEPDLGAGCSTRLTIGQSVPFGREILEEILRAQEKLQFEALSDDGALPTDFVAGRFLVLPLQKMHQDGAETANRLLSRKGHDLFELLSQFVPIDKVGFVQAECGRLTEQPSVEIRLATRFFLRDSHLRL